MNLSFIKFHMILNSITDEVNKVMTVVLSASNKLNLDDSNSDHEY